MQYVQRKLQRSVTEIRRSRKTRPRVSASSGVFARRLSAVAMMFDVVMRLSDSAGCAVIAPGGPLYSIVNNEGDVACKPGRLGHHGGTAVRHDSVPRGPCSSSKVQICPK